MPYRGIKLLMATDTVGGVWHYAIALCKALEPYGVKIVLATMGSRLSASQQAAASRLTNTIVAESAYRLEWMQDSAQDVADSGRWLLSLERMHRVDLVHVNGYAHAALPFWAPVVAVAHSDVLSWHAAVRGEDAPSSWDSYCHGVRAGLDRASVIVAPTRAVLDDLVKHFGPLLRPSCVIPNGIALHDLMSGRKRPVVMSIGRLWDAAKNFELLDRIADRLSWPIEIAGDSNHPDGGHRNFAHLRPLGPLSAPIVSRRLAEAAIYVAPALYEPFGLAILEAGAAGCALVLGDLPSLREIWADAAVYVPPLDQDAVVGALETLIADPERRREMGDRAQARARIYDIRRTAAGYHDLYLSLVRSPVAARA
jgi:glycosyltransferase involved in cell wall biosynthesis